MNPVKYLHSKKALTEVRPSFQFLDLRHCARNSVNPLGVKPVLLDCLAALDYDLRYFDLVARHLVPKRHAKRQCPGSTVAMWRVVDRAVDVL